MSRIKELKANPANNVNLVNVLELLVPDLKNKTKYIDTLVRVFNSDIKLQQSALDQRIEAFNLNVDDVNKLNKLEKIYLIILLNEKENRDAFMKYAEFCNYIEKGSISKNDLQSYKNFTEIFTEHEVAHEKEQQKLLEKQVIKLLDDDNWFAVIPLTYEASLKYGATTKWCTASTEYPHHYETYTKDGILIYTVNKKTKAKFAGYCKLKSSGSSSRKDITFWNSADDKIDGFSCGFSPELYAIFTEQFKLSEPNNTKISTIEQLRKKVLGTTKASMPKSMIKKKSPSIGRGEVAEPISAPVDENADYSDIYNTIVNYMGGRR